MKAKKMRGLLLTLGLVSQQCTVAQLQFLIESEFPSGIITSLQRKMWQNIFTSKMSLSDEREMRKGRIIFHLPELI